MIEAYPQFDGTFKLQDGWPYPKHGGAYSYRAQIKAAGGRWNGRVWIVTEAALDALRPYVTRMRRARVAAKCHNPEQVTFVSEQEIASGRHRLGCSLCDTGMSSGMTTEILEVVE